MNFFSVRVAKGVRISASSRGLRAHVGPRGARVHVGGGRPGVSTGAGPFTYYTGLGSSSRSRSSSRGGVPSRTQMAQAEKEQEYRRLSRLIQSILDVHRAQFVQAKKPSAPPSQPVDVAAFVSVRQKELLKDVPFWKLSDRKAAKRQASELAQEDAEKEERQRASDRDARQRELDEAWEQLVSNHPSTVIDVIDDAFEDNKAPAAPVNVEGSTLSLVMLAPGRDEIPDMKPAVTPGGKPTVKKMTKAEFADGYLTLITGHLLATIKEAIAVAPGVTDVKAVVVRRTEPDVYGNEQMEALLAGTYARSNLERVDWKDAEAPQIVEQAADSLMWDLRGRPPELKPLSLDKEPELKRFIDVLSEVKSES